VVEITKIWAFETLVLFYYTQVLGLSGALAGAALLLIMCVDAVSDPLVGQLSDRGVTRRFGRRHTFMFLALAPSAIFFFLLFSAPREGSQLGLFLWLLFTSIGLRVSLTFFAIPYSAQLAELTTEREDRSSAAVYRMLAGAAARLLLIYITFTIFFAPSDGFARGQENPQAYLGVATTGAVLILLFGLLSAWGTYGPLRVREADAQKREGASGNGAGNLREMMRRWAELLLRPGNANSLVLYSLVIATYTGCYGALAIYLGSYYWELDSGQLGTWNQMMIPGMVLMLLACTAILRRMEPKRLMQISLCLFFLSAGLPLLLAESGLIPRVGDLPRLLLYACKFSWGLAFGALIVCVPVMATESADRDMQLGRGTRIGLIFGLIFFATKAGNGLGGFLAGASVKVAGLQPVEAGISWSPSLASMQLIAWITLGVTVVGAVLSQMIVGFRYQHVLSAPAVSMNDRPTLIPER
jgi:Na+/melibiose symporter-like transporter